jgi:hypothetical protein
MSRVLSFPGRARLAAGNAPADDEPEPFLSPGVYIAPFTTLLGKRVLLCIAQGGVLLAQVAVNDGADEPELRRGMESLRALYDGC